MYVCMYVCMCMYRSKERSGLRREVVSSLDQAMLDARLTKVFYVDYVIISD